MYVLAYSFFPYPPLKDHQRLIFQVGHAALPRFDLSAPLAIQYKNLFSNPGFLSLSGGKDF
jgi:hypothetical protein